MRALATARNASMRGARHKNGHSFVARFSEPRPREYWDFQPTWHLQKLQNPHTPTANSKGLRYGSRLLGPNAGTRGEFAARRATLAHVAPAAPTATGVATRAQGHATKTKRGAVHGQTDTNCLVNNETRIKAIEQIFGRYRCRFIERRHPRLGWPLNLARARV